MIAVVSGKLGSGKSYWCVKHMVEHIGRGGIVATNLDLDFAEIRRAVYPRRLFARQFLRVEATMSPYDIPRGDFRGGGKRRVVVVLDEALNWFASEASAHDERKKTWGEWLRQSDKLGQDVFFVAQDFARAAKWIRELAQLSYTVLNFGQVSIFGAPIGRWLRLHRLCAVAKLDFATHTLAGAQFFVLSPKFWRCYSTSQLWGFAASGNAYEGVALVPAFRSPKWAWRVVLVLFVLGVVRYACAV